MGVSLGEAFRLKVWEMDISDSINFDKEAMLEALVERTGLDPEEFGFYYDLEEQPIEIFTIDNITGDMVFEVKQKFVLHWKTEAERQLQIGVKDGITSPE